MCGTQAVLAMCGVVLCMCGARAVRARERPCTVKLGGDGERVGCKWVSATAAWEAVGLLFADCLEFLVADFW